MEGLGSGRWRQPLLCSNETNDGGPNAIATSIHDAAPAVPPPLTEPAHICLSHTYAQLPASVAQPLICSHATRADAQESARTCGGANMLLCARSSDSWLPSTSSLLAADAVSTQARWWGAARCQPATSLACSSSAAALVGASGLMEATSVTSTAGL